MTTTAQRTSRLEARISPEQHALIKRAAELQDRTVTDFVVSAAMLAARQTVEDSGSIHLTLADQEAFAHAFFSDAEPAPALKKAMEQHKALIRQ